MSTQVGRISGPLLKDNLTRDGVDLAFETSLLYLDVNNTKVGIKTTSPIRDLQIVSGTKTTNLIVDNALTSGNVIFGPNSNISTVVGTLYVSAASPNPQTIASRIGVGNLEIDGNAISNIVTNDDIELRPNGTGKLKIYNDLNVYGSLHATGNITVDGNVIFGNNSSDNVVLSADVDSNIIPDLNNTYSIGESASRRWNYLYAGLLNGSRLTAGTIVPGSGIVPAVRQGNTWYVAALGRNDNVGNHQQGAFATVEKALSVAKFGDIVIIYPGVYEELFPLTVPAGVTVRGTAIRNTIIKPDTASTHEDVFLLNSDTTITDITIKDFFFDVGTNKGHAFRFAPNCKIGNRSPYIQNVSVITRGSITTLTDTLGFNQGDAGKGAYIDGSVCDPLSNRASMLFNSVTMITPGVDSVTMKNGVRVEWLNCFTYFANRGLYAVNGSLGFASQGTVFGAEVRSIGSANVYGNYGAYADGANTLMYLINHNFGYIGAGKDLSNDNTLTIQDNEITELNSGKIHYTSMDQRGTFRVGDTFYVDLENGTTSLDISTVVGNVIGISFEYDGMITLVDASKVETGNIRIELNNILSTVGPVNIASASDLINLNRNVLVSKDLAVSNNFVIDGTLYLGNEVTDSIVIFPKIDQSINPKSNVNYDLGSLDKNWSDLWVRDAHISDIEINTNYIRTTVSNANLELRANGTGAIWLEDIQVNQNVITTDSSNIQISPATTLDVTGNTTFNGNAYVTQNVIIDSNTIVGAATSNTVKFNNLVSSNIEPDINRTRSLGDTSRSWNMYTGQILLDDLEINDNYIRTTASNLNLELRANGTGAIRFEQVDFNENVISTNGTTNLEIRPASTLDIYANTTVNGNLNATGDFRFDGSITVGNQTTDTISFVAEVSSDLLPNIDLTYNLGSNNLKWKTVYLDSVKIDNIEINTNYIRTVSGNIDLELYGNGTGGVLTELLRFRDNVIENSINNQDMQVSLTGSSILDVNTNTALRVPRGTVVDMPILSMLSGEMRFNTTDSLFSGFTSARTTFSGVYSADRLTYARAHPINNTINFVANSTPTLTVSTTAFNVSGLLIDDITVNNNIISTNNTNLNLTPDGAATVDIFDVRLDDNLFTNLSNNAITFSNTGTGYLKFTGSYGMVIPAGTDAEQPVAPEEGTTRWNTQHGYLEIYINSTWQLASAQAGSALASEAEVLEIADVWTLILG